MVLTDACCTVDHAIIINRDLLMLTHAIHGEENEASKQWIEQLEGAWHVPIYHEEGNSESV